MVQGATVNHQEEMVHLHHAHTPGEENPTTIVGSNKITIDMKNKNELQGAMTMPFIFNKRTTSIAIAMRSMSHTKSSPKTTLTAPTTIKSYHDITTTITNIMLIMLKKNLKVNRFGMLVMMMRRSKIQGATMMHNHINMILVRRVVRE